MTTIRPRKKNRALCRAVLESVQAGDFFQMTGAITIMAKGAHSLLFIAAYDPATNEVRWTDSNMKNDSCQRLSLRLYAGTMPGQRASIGSSTRFALSRTAARWIRLRDDLFIR